LIDCLVDLFIDLSIVVVRNRSLLVEAVEQSIELDVIRSLGSVGVVSVDVVTQPGSAIGQLGPDLHLSRLQSVSQAQCQAKTASYPARDGKWVVAYIPFTRLSKHRAVIEQTSSKIVQNTFSTRARRVL